MRSIVMYYEAMLPDLPQEVLPPKPLPVQTRLSSQLLTLMKKDPELASQVATQLKNSENLGKMRARHLIKT